MSAVLQDPVPAVATAKPTDIAPLSIRDTVLAQFRATEPALKDLAERYRRVAFDLSTPKGLAAAKAARLDLRENGRYAVQRAEKRVKEEVNGLKTIMAAEVDRLVGITKPVEDHVHEQIEAHEERVAAEKAERDRIEAERRAKHEAGIARLRGYVDQARGKDAATIEKGLDYLYTLDAGPEWEDYADRAREVLAEVRVKLNDMMLEARAAEAAAVERERQRLENERRATELAEQERALSAQRAELARLEQEARHRIAALEQEAATREAERVAALAPPPAPAPEPEPVTLPTRQEAMEAINEVIDSIEHALTLPPAPPPLCEATIASTPGIAGLTVIEEAAEAPAAPVVTITAGQIGTRLGFRLPSEFIETTLGVTRLETRGAAVLWSEAAWPAIKDALVAHVLGLQ